MTTFAELPSNYQIDGNDPRNILDDLILSSSKSLTKCSINAIDHTIVSTLEELRLAAGADHAGWLLLREGSGIMEHLASAPTDLLLSKVGSVPSSELPWCNWCLLEGQSVVLADLAELPGQGDTDRRYLESFGVQSVAFVPVDAGELDRGILTLLSLEKRRGWSNTLARQCTLIGNIFLGARTRKVTREEKENSEANFREIFRSASVGMALEDTTGGLLYVNEALCTMLGYTEPEMMKMRCADFSHPADYERESILFNELFRKERQGYQIEKRFLHRTGTIIWGKVNVTLLRESTGGPCLILGIVEDITTHKSAIEKLTNSEMEIQSLASRLITSQEDERQRIARELHDDIGQRLSMVTSEVHVLNDARARKGGSRTIHIQRLSEELDSLVTDLHSLSHRLHSSKLQHLGVKSALRELCTQLARSGLHVDLTADEELEPVPEEIALCIYRIAQEALNNTLKHSGGNHASISLSKTGGGYSMMIKDTGAGFDTEAPSQGLGLISMKERLNPFKGQFSVKSIAGQGTEIVVRIPLRQPPDSVSPIELNYDMA